MKEKEYLETENFVLKEEVNRLMKYAPVSSVTHSRSVSNVSSINIEEDFGYSSAKNTLELKRDRDVPAIMTTPPASIVHDRTENDKERYTNDNLSDANNTPETFGTLSKLLLKC